MMPKAWNTLFVLAAAAPALLGAQQDAPYTERGPRFFLAASPAPVRIDIARTPALRRRIAVDLENIRLSDALDTIAKKGELHLMYSRTVLPLDRRVNLRAQDITVAAALTEVLVDTDADVLFARSGQAAVVSRVAPLTRAAVIAMGSVTGRVTDSRTKVGVASVRVTVERTNIAAMTGEDGRYRLTNIPAGAHQVTARRIGYQPRTVSVSVTDEAEATADIALDVATTMLSEVVVTGSITPTEVKALPTPITVVSSETIEQQHVGRFDEIIRLAVPGAVVWDQGANSSTVMEISVRGTNGLGSVAAKAPKVYIDGVEATVRHLAPVDPESIDHIEMIRGPQAAAVYGSDAIGGVIQIFTKRGTNSDRPVIEGRASIGTISSDFAGSGALQQDISGSVRGVNGAASYRVGGGYSHTGDWIPQYSMSQPSLNGGVRLEQGAVSVDLSTRMFWQNAGQPFDPRMAATKYLPSTFGFPTYVNNGTREETYSAQLGYRPRSWWQSDLTLGADRLALNYEQQQKRLSTPADTLLRVTVTNAQKLSMAFHTTVTAPLTSSVSSNLTAGVDHYVYTNDQFSTTGALALVPLRLATGQTLTAFRDRIENTGVFGQVQLSVRDALFLTGALRAEANSGFGKDLGMPVSPRVGATYVHDVGQATAKVRASYGEAIRAPTIAQRDGQTSANSLILPNQHLRPERQTGPDAGIDLVFGSRGSFGVTYYNQTAKDLIQSTTVDATTNPRTFQYQNLAKVKNVGWEFEGTLAFTRASLRGQYAFTDSKPVDLGTYTGTDYHVGEPFPDLPRHTAGLMVSATPLGRTIINAGLAYTGNWRATDYLAYFGCLGKTSPCVKPVALPSDYYASYPGFVALNLSVERALYAGVSGFIDLDDATNDGARRAHSNAVPVHGRVTTVGARVKY